MKNHLIQRLIVCVCGLLFFQITLAQTPEQDFDIYVIPVSAGPTENSTNLLADRLRQALSVNGRVAIQTSKDNSQIGGSESDNCFVMFPTINELARNVTTSPPILHTIELNITLYIAGYDISSTFGTYSFTVKGAGTTYEKAYFDAIKKINPSNKDLQTYIVNTKNKIRRYYIENCDYLMNEAESIAQRTNIDDRGYNSFMKSINILTQISKVNPKCYSEASTKVQDIYERFRKFACSYYLTMAKIQWAARRKGQTTSTGMDVFSYLRKIPPSTYCEKELEEFLKEIERNNVKFEDRDFNLAKYRDSTQATLEQKRLNNQSKLIDASVLSSIGAESRRESATTAVNILLSDGRTSPAKKD